MLKRLRDVQIELLFLIVISIVVTLLVTGIIVINQVSIQTKEQYLANSREQMKLVTSAIQIFYDQIDKDIDMLASHPVVMKADQTISGYKHTKHRVFMTPSVNGGVEEAIYQVFAHYARNHPGTAYVYLATEHGSYVQWPESQINAEYDPIVRPWYKKALREKGRVVRTSPYAGSLTNTLVTSNVKSLQTLGGEIAVVGIDVDQSIISDILSDLKTGESGFAIIVHTSGIILADGRNPRNNLKRIGETEIKELSRLLDDGEKPFETTIMGVEYHVNPRRVAGTDWVLGSFISTHELAKNVKNIIIVVMLVSLGILLLIGFVIAIFTKRLTKPIDMVKQFTNGASDIDFTRRIEHKFLYNEEEK